MSRHSNSFIYTTLNTLIADEPKSIISGPFGSNIGKRFFQAKGIPVIRGNNLSVNTIKFIDSGFVFVTREKADELNCYAIPNDIIFTAVGTIGQVGLIEEGLDYQEYVISNKQIRVRFDSNKIFPLYAFYWFSSKWMQNIINQRNVGSTVPLLNLWVVRGLPIKLPKSIITQRNIVDILENISYKIELNNKINHELEAMAKTIYDYWFVQFDFPNEQGKPYKSSGGKMVYNKELKREIPEGWEVVKMIENMDVQYGFPYSTKLFNNEENGVPVIRIRDILESTISLFSTEKADDKYKIDKGDLLIGMDGNFHMNFWDKENCYLNQRCVKIKQKNEYSVSTFQTLFDTQPYIKAREKNVSRTTVGHLSANDINGLNIMKASDNIQIQANKIFDAILDKILINRNENQELTALRDWLLPMLMNGQVTVGEAEEKLNMAAEPQAEYKKG